ncbi:MAG: monovalent cation/H(+) antiporter subunit G [Myxococcales bacterium]|nr:monovalent cation/H(+) antiporter subunit G [Myxococcales bacterium]
MLALIDAAAVEAGAQPYVHYVVVVLLALGCVISLTGSLGLLRFPDFYTRLHTAGKTDSLAQLCIFLGLALVTEVDGHAVDPLVRLKLLMVALILFFTAPTATHAITKAAHLDGLVPWKKGDPEPGE